MVLPVSVEFFGGRGAGGRLHGSGRRVAGQGEEGKVPRDDDSIPKDYVVGDPVLSGHIKPFVQRDMLLVENQLPLRLLEKIVAAERGTSPSAASLNSMVLKFLERGDVPLDIYRTSLLDNKAIQKHVGVDMDDAIARPQRVVPRSAWNLSGAGMRFLPSKTSYLDDIKLRDGRLYMPRVLLDDSTAYKLHNMMVFEAMHLGTGTDVLFVKDLVDSADDVRLLVSNRILQHDLADDDAAVVSLFNDLTRDVPKNWESQLYRVRKDVEDPVRVFLYEWWANFRRTYFRSLWALITAILIVVIPVVGDILQTVYAIISYELNKGSPKMN